MPQRSSSAQRVVPPRALPGSRVTLHASAPFGAEGRLPEVSVGGLPARVVFLAPARLAFLVPEAAPGGHLPVAVDGVDTGARVEVGTLMTAGVHQVDSPAFDQAGGLYVTFSGSRGETVPVSVFRVEASGERREFATGIVNPTSMAVGPDGHLYVSSRFEGAVYRVRADGAPEVVATELGVACGLAFDPDGVLFVGDRTGTIFRVELGGATRPFAQLPASVAAFHLAFGPERWLYVTAPTLNAYDHVYRVGPDGQVEVFHTGFGRPQGLAFDASGRLHVADSLAGESGVYRFRPGGVEQVVSGRGLIGVAFEPGGDMAVASDETVYRFGAAPRPRARQGRSKATGPM